MARVLFAPFSVAASLIAGLLAGKAFERVWALFDDTEPPEAGQRDADPRKLVVGAALRAAVFATVRTLTDRYARATFLRTFGTWPGERKQPQAP